MLTVHTLLALGPGAPASAGDAPPSVGNDLPAGRGVAFHSGRVRPGDVFFALPGEREHGIVHADAALAAGAAWVVSDRPHPRGVRVADPAALLLSLGRHARARLGAPVIAVTGSAGKTSAKAMLAAALDARSSPGNFNTPHALACTLVDAWLAADAAPLVLELGIDRPGEMDDLVRLVAPSHGLLTAVAPSHLEALGSVARVAAEKAKLLETSGRAYAAQRAAEHLDAPLRARVHRYGLDAGADTRGRVIASSLDGQRLAVAGVEVALARPGRAMAENAVGAMAVARDLGVAPAAAAARLGRVAFEGGRLEPKRAGGARLIDDSYNSNPASAAEAGLLL